MPFLTVERHYPPGAPAVATGTSAMLDLELGAKSPQLLAATVELGILSSGCAIA